MKTTQQYTLTPRRRRLRFIGLVAFPIFGAVMMMMMATRAVRQPSVPATVVMPVPPRSVSSANVARRDTSGLPNSTAVSDTLLADVYPSRSSAIRALARRLPDQVGKLAADKSARVILDFDQTSADGAPIAEALRKEFVRDNVVSAAATTRTATTQPAAGEVIVRVKVVEDAAKSTRRPSKGEVQVTIASASRSARLGVKFSQCDWADDLGNYINEHPGHNWLVVRSRKPGLTPAEARRSAEESAVDALEPLVPALAPSRVSVVDPSETPAPARQVDARNLPIVDRFTQQFHRPYGDVWDEAILLDASPQWAALLQARQVAVAQVRAVRVGGTLVSMVIVLGAILAAYAFANVVTRRYFTGRLRAIAIGVALVAVAIAVGIITVA